MEAESVKEASEKDANLYSSIIFYPDLFAFNIASL